MLFFPPSTFTGIVPSLPTTETEIGFMVFADGFGVVNNQGEVSDIVRRAVLSPINLEQCQGVFGNIIANENIFCAWCPGGGTCNRVCSGDQGGAVINIADNGLVTITKYILH